MNPVLLIAVAAVLIVGFVAFRVWQNKAADAKLTVSTCGETPHPGGTMDPQAWFTGPLLTAEQGGTKSPGMPLHPTVDNAGGLVFDFPVGVDLPLGTGDKLDSSAFCHGPLTGKKLIRLRYRLDLIDPTAEIIAVPETNPTDRYKARITPYFQRKGDNWTASGEYEPYRWYYDQTPDLHYLEPGEHDIVASFDSGWGATQTSTQASNPAGFQAAIDNCCCVGFVLGGNENGLGHGARATAPARLTILGFTTE